MNFPIHIPFHNRTSATAAGFHFDFAAMFVCRHEPPTDSGLADERPDFSALGFAPMPGYAWHHGRT